MLISFTFLVFSVNQFNLRQELPDLAHVIFQIETLSEQLGLGDF